jgi:hypothetical protein
LLEKGDTTLAIASYRKSVELDPGMSEAIQRLKELAPAGSGERRIEGNTIISDSLPSVRLTMDSSLGYLGRQTFVLYNVANADQFFFAELVGKRVKRFVWVQFEGYLPGLEHTYDYSRDSTIAMWGKTLYRNSALRATPTSESRPDSDGVRARAFLRERGLTLAPNMLYHRLVWLLDQPARNELMIIYMEDPADYNPTGALDGALLRSLLNLSLRRAEQSISIRPR